MNISYPERLQKPITPLPNDPPDEGNKGPKRPQVDIPDPKKLIEKMKRVDPDQVKRYRQRGGE